MASENCLNLVHDIGTLSNKVVRPLRRAYKCTFCIKTFTVHSNLVKHTRTHTGERPFKCEVCEKAFANPSNLTRHRRIHTGVRPHKCGFCQKGFRDASNLRYHLKTHLNDTSFTCQECGDTFSEFTDYCAHMKIHFDITSELLNSTRLPSPNPVKTSSPPKNVSRTNSNARKSNSGSSSFPSFISSNDEVNGTWKLSLQAALSVSSDVQNSCDISPENSIVQRHQNVSSFKIEPPTMDDNMDSNNIVPGLEPATLSKESDSNFDTNQVGAEQKLVSSLSATKVVGCDDKVLSTKQEKQTHFYEENSGLNQFSTLPSATDLKDWNLFSLKDEVLNTIDANVVHLEKEKSTVFQFDHLAQTDEINLQDDSTCTLDELANKLTQCIYCERIFSLEDSNKQLLDGKPYCGTCDKVTANRTHSIIDSTNLQEKNLCVLCDSLFEDPDQLKQHICVTNMNGKRYNPCLKLPAPVDSNVDKDFKEFDDLKSNFLLHHDDLLQGIKVLGQSSFESQNFLANGNKSAHFGITGIKDLSKENSNEPKQIELETIDFESVGMDRSGEGNEEDDEEVIIIENILESNGTEEESIHEAADKTNMIRNDGQSEKNIVINDDEVESISKFQLTAVENNAVEICNSENNISDKNFNGFRDNSSWSEKKNFNMKNKMNGKVLNKTIKENKLKNSLVQATSKEEEDSGPIQQSCDLRFKCRYCDKGFSIQGNLIKHIRIHTGEKPFKCTFCGTAFANSSNLTRHIRTHTGEKPYKCLYCERRFRASSNMRSHQRTHLKCPALKCNMCGEQFSLISLYRLHLKSHLNRQSPSPVHTNRKTSLFGMQRDDESLLNNDSMSSSLSFDKQNEKDAVTANKHDSTHKSLENEERSITYSPPIPQNSLDFTNQENSNSAFFLPDSLQTRIKPNNVVVIDLENNSLNSYDHPDSNNSIVFPPPSSPNNQEIENLDSCRFSEKFPEDFHKNLQKSPTLFKNCSNSDLTFELDPTKSANVKSANVTLKSLGSSSIMSKLRPYRCVYCSKGFTVHCNLVKHIRIHTGEKPFSCKYCGKAFANPSNLTRHLRTHTGEHRPYKCHLCSCNFQSSNNLTIHLKSHSSSVPKLEDTFCEEALIQNKELKNGLRKNVKDKKLKRPPSNLAMRQTSLQKSLPGDRIFSSSITVPSFSHFRNPSSFTKPKFSLKYLLSGRTALPYKQKRLKRLAFMSESSRDNHAGIITTFQSDSPETISSKLTPKCPTQRLQFLNEKENSSETEEISIQHPTSSRKIINNDLYSQSSRQTSNIVDANNEDAPNCLLTEKLMTLSDSVGEDQVEIEKEPEPTMSDRPDESDDDRIPSLSLPEKLQNSQTMPNPDDSPRVKLENPEELLSVVEPADPTETTHPTKATVKFRTSKLHKCRFCARLFPSRCNLIKHVRTHTGEKPFRCKYCRAAFANPSNLTRHVRTHTGEKPYLCPYCSKTFRASSNLKQHLKTHHQEGIFPYKCRQCNKTFSMFSNFKLHTCSQSKSGLRHSSNQDSPPSPLLAPSSQKDFCNKLSDYNRPLEILGQETKSRLKVKDAIKTLDLMNRKQILGLSKVRITKSSNTESPDKFSSSSESVIGKNNILIVKSGNGNSIRIEPKSKADSPHFETTSESLDDKTPPNATSWTESPSIKPNLLVVPTFKRRLTKSIYKCVYCEKTFSVSSNLTKHVRTHTGEKPFKCRFCSKAFANPSNLSRHERIHTGERPYQCPHCPQDFASSGNLKDHVKKHNTLKLNNCLIQFPSFSKMGFMKRKPKTVKDKSYNSKNLYKANFISSKEQTSSVLTKPSEDAKDLDNSSAEESSTTEGSGSANRFNILKQPFDGINSRNLVRNLLVSSRNTNLPTVSDFKSQILNSTRKPETENKVRVKQEPQEDSAILTDFCLNSAYERTNTAEEIKKEEIEEKPKVKDRLFANQDLLVLLNPDSMDQLDEENNTNTTEPSTQIQSFLDSVLNREDFLNSNQNSSENFFSQPNIEEVGLFQCQVCYLTFFQNSELREHMEVHITPPEDEAQNRGNLAEELSPNSLDYKAGNIGNENISYETSELYICKYGCQTFGSYLDLKTHMKIHTQTKDHMKNSVQGSNDDDADDVQQNVDQKENSFLLESLNIQTQPMSTTNLSDLDLYNGSSFMSSLDSTQQLLSAKNTQPCISPPAGSAIALSLSQSDTLKNNNFPVTWQTRETLKPHACPYCGKSFSKRGQLTKHIRTHTGETPHKCCYCGTGFANPSNLTRHIRTHTGEKPYQCPICKKAFGNSSNMKEHLKIHSKTSLYKCKYCEKKFLLFYPYKMHLKNHSKFQRTARTNKRPESPVNIIVDNKSNSSEEIVKLYETENDRMFSQSITKLSKSKSDTWNISDSKINDQSEIIKLDDDDDDDAVADSIVYLDNAATPSQQDDKVLLPQGTMKQTQPEQLINLVDFYQTFSSSNKYDSHHSPNQNSENFQPNKFESRKNKTGIKLNRSKNFNTLTSPASRLHVCSYCQKPFTIHSNLRKHIRIHTGERPFKCHTCVAAFANPSNLTRHIRTHTGEKPYLCPHCSKSFRASSNLKVHLKMIHTQR